MLMVVVACFEMVMKCYEEAVKKSGRQLKEVSPVADAGQWNRQRHGKEKLPARDWFEAMPIDVAQQFALALAMEFGLPAEVKTAAAIGRQMEVAR